MTQVLQIHAENPQLHLIREVVEFLNQGGVVVYPTDSAYALGCKIGSRDALQRIRLIRNLDKKHNFTLMCRNLSEIATYSYVDNPTYRLLKANTPGAYTFILQASKEVPRMLQHPKRKTIGLRVPDNRIVQAILAELGAPLMSVTLMLPEQEDPIADPNDVYELLKNRVDLIVDGGFCGIEPTTVVDLVDGVPKIVRVGKGDPSSFL